MHLLSNFLLWAQQPAPPVMPQWLVSLMKWLLVYGDLKYSIPGFLGGLITWSKLIGLFAFSAWVISWAASAVRTKAKAKWDILDMTALVALGGCVLSEALNVFQGTKRISPILLQGYPVSVAIAQFCMFLIVVWVERAVWTAIRRMGRASDVLVLVGIHLALLLGIAEAYVLNGYQLAVNGLPFNSVPISVAITQGLFLGATYMGFVVLARLLWLLIPEIAAIRPRRLFAIAKLAVVEANRRMWAPWVVLILFGVFLAFTHWFIPASQQRLAELGRYYVGTLTLLCMLLLTVMVTILAPLSLPQDIQAQTIYTVVSKPVRRLELIWGRMLGYMTMVTVLVIIFGGVSLVYFDRNIRRTIDDIDAQAAAVQQTDPEKARYLADQAEQLRTRMSARRPVKGSLSFIDSRGTKQKTGIDVGQELEFRSHIEGATPAAAIWLYGSQLQDPQDPKIRLNRPMPVTSLLVPGTIEAIENQAFLLEARAQVMEAVGNDPSVPAAKKSELALEITKTSTEVQRLRAESQKLIQQFNSLITQAKADDAAKRPEQAEENRQKAAVLHSPPIEMQMTFTIYRTTKGRVGDPVYAEIEVENPRTNVPKFRDTFPIREYYTNKRTLPSSYLVGSMGDLKVSIRCMSPTQYLGMSESDFYFLASSGDFNENYFKGLFGVWLQALVLTAIGVFAGSFLSWPVALLFTIAFFIAGHAAVSILKDFFLQTVLGGGPFESLIRLVTHDNQVTELAPTLGVIVAKTLDSIVMPIMSGMVYLIPNLSLLDVSNTVAEGFVVEYSDIWQGTMIALAYAIPFSIGGYFILKNREVAA